MKERQTNLESFTHAVLVQKVSTHVPLGSVGTEHKERDR
jgi:hypothetical protein